MAMNMRCRDQSWSGRAVDCFDIGIECGREIHGENEVLLKVKFCEGKGCSSLWNEVWRDDGWWWWCDEVCVGVKFCEGKGWMFPARINFRWDGDIHGNHAFGWEWIFVRGRGVCVYVGRFVWGLVWCRDVLCFLYNWNSVRWMGIYLYEMRFGEMLGDVVMPLSFLYNSNFMWWTTNYLYLVPFPTMMSTSSLYTHPLRFRSYSKSMRFIYICSMLESISAMKTLSTLHLQSSSIRRENHQSRFCIYLLWKKKVWKKEMRRSRTREGMRVLLYNRRSDWWRCV